MAKAAEAIRENIRDQFLQCKICLDELKSPKTLPCLHTFCYECLAYYIDHNRLDHRKFACPFCRRHIYIPSAGVDGFPDSFFVENLQDIVVNSENTPQPSDEEDTVISQNECGICRFKDVRIEAGVLCIECRVGLCDECARSHTAARVTQNHTLLPFSQHGTTTNRDNFCRVHKGETIKYYCVTCNSPICLPCTFLDHQAHDIEEIQSVRQGFSRDMEGLVMQSEDNLLQLETLRDDLRDLEADLFMRKESGKAAIRRAMQEAARALSDQETRLLSEVDLFYDTLAVGRDRQKVERTIYRLQQAHDFAKTLLSPDTSPISQLVNRTEARDSLTQALEYELPDTMVHAKKLDRFMYFLPGRTTVQLGSLLQCTEQGESPNVSAIRPVQPVTRAMLLHKLKSPPGQTLPEVVSMAILASGDVVLLTTATKKVQIYTQRGRLRHEFGDEEELQQPTDMVVTRDSELAFTDCGMRQVRVFDQFGAFSFYFGDEEVFSLPIALTVDGRGRYLVCDREKQQLTVHRSRGEILLTASVTDLTSPEHISWRDNVVFLCDPEHKEIGIYSYDGTEVIFVAKMTAGSDEGDVGFLDCSGICADAHGGVCIADTMQNKVHVFNARGELSSIVGTPAFVRPQTIAMASCGLMAVAQQGATTLEGSGETPPSSGHVCVYRLMRAEA